jgi:hypothetical protein
VKSPANSLNPFDDVGIIHNQGLDYFMKNFSDRKMTVREIVKETDKYLLTNTLFSKNMKIGSSNGTLSTDPEMVSEVLADKDNNFKSVISKAECSDYAKSKLTHFFSLILSEKDNENADYNLMYGKIIDFEKTIIDDKSLNENDKKVVLMSSSIGRHSLYYWYTSIPQSKKW